MATTSSSSIETFQDAWDLYKSHVDTMGEAILVWADPNNEFRGYTNVCVIYVYIYICE